MISSWLKTAALCCIVLGTAACDKGDPTSLSQQIIVEENDIQSIQVSSQNANNIITTGDSLQLIAEGLDSSSNVIDVTGNVSWSSSDYTLATVDSDGLVTSHADGVVTITATLVNYTATFDITLSSASLVSVAVTASGGLNVSVCRSLQLRADGTYDDSSVRNITDQVSWSTSSAGAAFSAATPGLLNTQSVNTVNVTASLSSIDGLASVTVVDDLLALTISPLNASTGAGHTQTYTATADYTSATGVDISANASWSSSDTNIASFSGAVASTSNPGTVTITGSCSSLSATTMLTVTGLALTELDFGISPPYLTLNAGSTYQLTVTGTYSDNSTTDLTDSVSWQVVNLSGASGSPITVNTTQTPIGQVQANSTGLASVEAEINGVTAYIVIQVL